MSSNLLIQEPPLQVLPTLAEEIGLDEAIVLQQLHYWITVSKKKFGGKKFYDDKWWVYNTYEEWQDTDFPFWSTHKIGRIFRNLEDQGIIFSMRFEASDWNQRKWYTIDYANLHDRIDQNCTFLIGSTETSSETTTTNSYDLCIDTYKKNISKTVEPIVEGAIKVNVDKYGEDAVIEAIAIAVKAKKKQWNYIEGILKNQANPEQIQQSTRSPDGGFDL